MSFNAGEDTFFKVKKFLNCRGRILELSTPKIMAIMNLTSDSFYDGGKTQNENQMISIAESLLNAGADIIDIGGQSTRPKSKRISADEEWNRIEPAITSIHKKFP